MMNVTDERVLPQGQSINVDKETFAKILDLWFNTLDIGNAKMISTKDIIQYIFKYYAITCLCSFFTINRDLDDFTSRDYEWKIHSNGGISWNVNVVDGQWINQRKHLDIMRINNYQCEIQQLVALLAKLPNIAFRQESIEYSVSHDTTTWFRHCDNKVLAQLYDVDITKYGNKVTDQVINNFVNVFDFLKAELTKLKISSIPSFKPKLMSVKIGKNRESPLNVNKLNHGQKIQ